MNRHLYIIFALLVLSLLLTLGIILGKEMNPEWKRYQKAYYRKETEAVTRALARAEGTQRTILQKQKNDNISTLPVCHFAFCGIRTKSNVS